MVEQMVSSNLSKYGLGKCASISTTSDEQPSPQVSVKNTISQHENKNRSPRTFENSAPQKETAFTQAKSPPTTSNLYHNLVYARRKSDSEVSNSRISDKNRTLGHQQPQQLGDKEVSPQKEAKIEVDDNSAQPVSPTPVSSMATPVGTCGNEQSAVVNFPAIGNWTARFVQLQNYLKQCDSSNPEGYVQKLRTFSPDECSRHAIELERRAIQLMLEEGKEIQRVKDLNILAAGNYSFRPLTPVFKSENL